MFSQKIYFLYLRFINFKISHFLMMTDKRDYVLFDFDGTLVDSFGLFKEIIFGFKGKYFEGTPDFEKYRNAETKSFIKDLGVFPTKVPFILPDLRREFSKRICSCNLFPNMEEVLDTLSKDYKTGIISCNSPETICSFLKSKNLEKYFDFIEGNSFFLDKHHAIQRTLYKQGAYADNSHAIYVGDEAKDVTSARRLGVPCMAVTYGYNNYETLVKHNPTYVAHSAKGIVYDFLMLGAEDALEPSIS